MTPEEAEGVVEWYRSRPPIVQVMIQRFPPGSKVKAVAGRELTCPAPGIVGSVISYTEHSDGTAGVRVSDGVWGACCDPDWLEIVDVPEDWQSVLALIRTLAN